MGRAEGYRQIISSTQQTLNRFLPLPPRTGDLKETQSQQRQRHKSSSSPESTGSSGVSSSLARQASDSGNYQKTKTPPSLRRGSSQDPIIAQQAALMSQTEVGGDVYYPVHACTKRVKQSVQ